MLGLILSALGLGGLGAAAFLYPPFGALLLTAARAAFSWLSRQSPATLLCLVLCLALAIDHIALLSAHRHIRKADAQLVKCSQGRAADKAAYAKAQNDAAAANLAHNAADKAERERITHDVSQSYEAELASLRADLAKRLRQPAPQSASNGSGLPQVSPAPSEPDGGSRVSIPTSLYVRGAELELQLEKLQQWVAEQVKIDPNEGTRSK
jgi:hypothetical protein